MAVIVSTKAREGRKVYHRPDCIHSKRMKHKKEITLTKAKSLGYTECKHCSGFGAHLLDNKHLFKTWKERDGLKFHYDMGPHILYVWTDVGFWRLSLYRGTNEISLFHRNIYDRNLTLAQAKAGKFHRQTELAPTSSLHKVINFIINHDKAQVIIKDDYRKLPKNTKKQRKYYRYAEKREKKKELKRLDELFEQIKTK